MLTDHSTPYANLDPNLILQAVESLGLQCSGTLLALNSYENRVYQVGLEDEQFLIAKFYRPNRWTDEAILEEHEFSQELVSHEIPVIPPLPFNQQTLHYYEGYRFALFPRQGGRALELDNLEHLEWMGRFIGRIHAIGALKKFENRIELNVETYGNKPYQFLLEHHFIPDYIHHNYCQIIDQALACIKTIFEETNDIPRIRLHGDCHAGNVLWTDAGPKIVDLDDCLMGPAIQDLWMLLSGDKEQIKIQLSYILSGYEEFYDFNYRELRLIEALRTLRMLHYSGWLAARVHDPAFKLNFPWFNTPNYWQDQLQQMNEQLVLLEMNT